jgi:hypothetical protein
MNQEQIKTEFDNLAKALQKLDNAISLNLSGKFIVSHEKIIGARQIIMNGMIRMQNYLEDKNG